jgi:hypothetical protein
VVQDRYAVNRESPEFGTSANAIRIGKSVS